MGASTHRRQRCCQSNKNTDVSIDASIMKTSAFFFARHGRVAVGEKMLTKCRDRRPRLSVTNNFRKRHGVFTTINMR